MSSPKFQAPPGTHDVLAPESDRWQHLVALFAQHAARAGFGLLQTPMFEDIGVFQRMGEGTDVVRKEMYEFEDRAGRHLALRPEGTASVVRAFNQHHPIVPWKAWYVTPCFRYEKSQAGRYRQHHQLGCEILGTSDPDADVEVIVFLRDFYAALGLERVDLVINSMGLVEDRQRYVEVLRTWLTERIGDLADDDRENAQRHPMRVLDSKRRQTREITSSAPKLADSLSGDAIAHFDRVQSGLASQGIPFVVDQRLVRGLDYYNHTTFEFQAGALDAAQNTIGGGGRYDGLAESLGGKSAPGVGFGSGIERILLACDAEETFTGPDTRLDVFVIDTTGGTEARDLVIELRRAGVRADRAFDQKSMKAQMKNADRSGAIVGLIVGPDERDAGSVAFRELRNRDSEQVTIDRREVVGSVLSHLGTARDSFLSP
ncbi:MAG: histidine--tRNA ligase [Actinomycetia bacterium]|nr:histidine--tRNA ligase [Actinomycetes bacterium]